MTWWMLEAHPGTRLRICNYNQRCEYPVVPAYYRSLMSAGGLQIERCVRRKMRSAKNLYRSLRIRVSSVIGWNVQVNKNGGDGLSSIKSE